MMEVRVKSTGATNKACVEVWENDRLITTLEVSSCCFLDTFDVKTTLNLGNNDQNHVFTWKD